MREEMGGKVKGEVPYKTGNQLLFILSDILKLKNLMRCRKTIRMASVHLPMWF